MRIAEDYEHDMMEGLSSEDFKAQRFGSDSLSSQSQRKEKDDPPADMPFSSESVNAAAEFFKAHISLLSGSEHITEPADQELLCQLPEFDNDNPDPEHLNHLLKLCERDLNFYRCKWEKSVDDAMKSLEQQDVRGLYCNWYQAHMSGRKVLAKLELEHRLKELIGKENIKAMQQETAVEEVAKTDDVSLARL